MRTEPGAVPDISSVGQCGEEAASCRCVKPSGHEAAGDDVHSCDPAECTGQWRGSFERRGFSVVEFPVAVRPAALS